MIPKPKTGVGAVAELLVIVALALGLALGIQAFLIKPYQIPSQSMEPTLDVGQRVLVNRFGYHFGSPSVGDIVVFHPPQGADRGNECGTQIKGREPVEVGSPCPLPTRQEGTVNFIKRIVAGPGDTLAVKDGHPVVNGRQATESFILPCRGGTECNLPRPIKIPAGHYFMMGDNRGQSDDSRFWGPVPRRWIVGKAFLTYWPLKRIGFL
ncbi:MAG: signal peptidase [Solirubrobacterales bacterium]|nr:signal peptidase [Solirubrobacterales bacterium]MDX6662666.1 signal peptidase [Solirubrobacterales bacterium]